MDYYFLQFFTIFYNFSGLFAHDSTPAPVQTKVVIKDFFINLLELQEVNKILPPWRQNFLGREVINQFW
jgi:hypothetical protein